MIQEKTKPISIKEFLYWLQGVEEMQTDGWTPDARQWERIRAKINLIDTASVPQLLRDTRGFPPDMEAVFPPLNGNPPASAPIPSSLNMPVVPPQSRVRSTTTPGGLPVSMGGVPVAVPVKTPDIDTSHGKPYNSNFA